MKKNILVCLLVSAALLFTGCNITNYRNEKILAKRIEKMEKASGNPGSIEDIQKAIKEYDADAKTLSEKNAKIGIWYKILGTRYLDKRMYGEALKAFQAALQFYPDNENLYYYVGVCAANMSRAALDYDGTGDTSKKENYLKLAESSLLQAVQIYDRYANALRALGNLYLGQMNEPEKSIQYFERALQIETKDTDLMMYLAQAYYMTERFDDAAAMYDRVIATTKSADRKALAESNKKVVLDASYGN